MTSPALAPWITAVGNASHNAVLGNTVQDFSGGSLPAPETMVGASRTDGTSKLVIVHARDYGNALCGEGEPELQANCADNTGASNPWKGEKPFNGEIVVCDRGTYGRVEKGKNVLQAGAGGYILANTSAQGESIVADDHCLPASHLGAEDGDELRAWLAARRWPAATRARAGHLLDQLGERLDTLHPSRREVDLRLEVDLDVAVGQHRQLLGDPRAQCRKRGLQQGDEQPENRARPVLAQQAVESERDQGLAGKVDGQCELHGEIVG